VTVIDLLPWALSRGEAVEQAIRAALEGVPGGPWAVTLRPQPLPDSGVAVVVRGGHSVLLTSFARDATAGEITARLVRDTRTAD
jgi:hypothetical protein